MTRKAPSHPGPPRWGIIAMGAFGLVTAGTFAALTLAGLRPHATTGAVHEGASSAQSSSLVIIRHRSATPTSLGGGLRAPNAPVELTDATPPWQTTPENSPPLPAGYVPAWVVKPPAPDPNGALPEPVEPPDPLTTPPPMDNPGGVNGDRPERPVPGLEAAAPPP